MTAIFKIATVASLIFERTRPRCVHVRFRNAARAFAGTCRAYRDSERALGDRLDLPDRGGRRDGRAISYREDSVRNSRRRRRQQRTSLFLADDPERRVLQVMTRPALWSLGGRRGARATSWNLPRGI